MERVTRGRVPFAIGGILILYCALSFRHLDRTPPIHEDEPWIASVAWKVASEATFGSDLFRGYYEIDTCYLGFPPLFALLLAPAYLVSPPGVLQGRLINAALGLLILLLTWRVGRRTVGEAPATVAMLLLMAAPLNGVDATHLTGILLLDNARLGRYDLLLAVLGLGAAWCYLQARATGSGRFYLFAGLCAGLAGLTNYYGLWWAGVLLLLAAWNRDRLRHAALLILGTAIVAGPYALLVLANVDRLRSQMREEALQVDLLNPSWHVANLVGELRRYSPGLGTLEPSDALRIALWTTLVAAPIGLFVLLRRAAAHRDEGARLVVVALLLFPLLFSLVSWRKHPSYATVFWPFLMVSVASGLASIRSAFAATRPTLARRLAIALVVLVACEGATRWAKLEAAGRRQQPFAVLMQQVRTIVPPGARVLGLHADWFGMHDTDYRTWLVPFSQIDPRLWSPPLTMAAALDRIAPDWVLIDARMRRYFDTAPPGDRRPREILDWMAARGFVLAKTLTSDTYGTMEVHQRAAAAGGTAANGSRKLVDPAVVGR